MRLLVLSYERLISNGSAGTTVMCGLVDSALDLGWEVTYLALCRSEMPEDWEAPFDFGGKSERLHQALVCYSRVSVGRVHRFKGAFDHSSVTRLDIGNNLLLLREYYDLVIAFDSLPMALASSVENAKKTIFIIGDPAGRRLWHSSSWIMPGRKFKAILLDIAEIFHYRRIPRRCSIAMFGSGHSSFLSRVLSRPILDIRPFIPIRSLAHVDRSMKERLVVFFGGTLSGTASGLSRSIILEGILPALRSRFGPGGFEMRLVGDSPESFKNLADSYEEIKITGRVASFEAELASGDVFILPMDYPVGVRTRICSALAAGNICLVHPSVLYNMPELVNCSAVRLVDTPDQYAKYIAEIPRGSDLLALRQSARDFFSAHYLAQVSSKKLLDIIERE